MSKVYFNANLFNGEDAEIKPNSWFEVDGQRIVAMGTGTPDKSVVDEQINLKGQYVMPGIINAHTHIMMDPIGNKLEYLSETEATVRALRNLSDLLHAGVTYIRDCGCAFNTDIKLKQLVKDFHFDSPEIVASGRPMSMTGGHGDFIEGEDGEADWAYLVDSPDEMRKATRIALKRGADNIKVMATGGVMSAGDNIDDTASTVAEMREAVAEAHHKGKTVAAHAQGHAGIQNALDAGVDSIEHGIYVDEKQAAYMVEHNVYLVPTLNASAGIAKYGRDSLPAHMIRKNDQVKADFFKNIGMAVRKGVKVVVGTDAGTPFNSFKTGTAEEMALLVNEVGATPVQALFGASKYAAALLQIDKDYGTLEVGKVADFLVLENDPTQDITAVAQPDKMIFKLGTQVK